MCTSLSKAGYGAQKLNSMETAKLEMEEESRKRHPFDFALWKGAPENPAGTPPGVTRPPGLAHRMLSHGAAGAGQTIDIHLGGADLVFPHHENEIAQSETGRQTGEAWMHNGMVNVGGTKMQIARQLHHHPRPAGQWISPMTLRLFVLQAHYRKPLDFTAEALEAAAIGFSTPPSDWARPVASAGPRQVRWCGHPPGQSQSATSCRASSSASSAPWMTTSTAREPWPCCLTWPNR